MSMARRELVGAITSGALCLVLVGCGGTATPSPSASTAAELPSQAAPSVATPSVAAPSAEGSAGTQASGAQSGGASDLEALLPDTLCGAAAVKTSRNGAQLSATGGSDLAQAFAALAALGKSSNDIGVAVATAPNTDCTVGILRITGIDATLLQSAMNAAAAQSGSTATQTTIGGKTVWKTVGPTNTTYTYFNGDKVVFATAKSDAEAESIFSSLP
jgi:hypothetical protein